MQLFMQFGIPKVISSDQGSEFNNNLDRKLMKRIWWILHWSPFNYTVPSTSKQTVYACSYGIASWPTLVLVLNHKTFIIATYSWVYVHACTYIHQINECLLKFPILYLRIYTFMCAGQWLRQKIQPNSSKHASEICRWEEGVLWRFPQHMCLCLQHFQAGVI